MTFAENVTALATRIATEAKSLRTLINGNASDLSALQTTAKSNLVAAINELKGSITGGGATIDDSSTNTTSVWSSSKTNSSIGASFANAVRTDTAAQGLTTTQKSNARTNIGAGTSNLAIGTTSGTAADAATLATSLAAKAPLASPTFTGTVSGITKSMVGLSSVDNTADASKPVSTAQAAAIALKVDASLVGDTTTDFVAAFNAGLV